MKHSLVLLLTLLVTTSCVRPPAVDSQVPLAGAEEPQEEEQPVPQDQPAIEIESVPQDDGF